MTTNSIHSSEKHKKDCLIKSKIPATPKPYSERKEKKECLNVASLAHKLLKEKVPKKIRKHLEPRETHDL